MCQLCEYFSEANLHIYPNYHTVMILYLRCQIEDMHDIVWDPATLPE